MNNKSNGHSSESSETKKVILTNDNPVSSDPAWFIGAKKAFKPFYWVSGITLVWCLISYFELLEQGALASGTLLASAILFLLSIPTGIFLRMDMIAVNYAGSLSTEGVLILSLPILLLNFVLIGAYLGWRKKFKKSDAKNTPKT